MDRGEPAADLRGEGAVDAAGHQVGLPQPVAGRVEPFHGEEHRLVVMGEDARRRRRARAPPATSYHWRS